MNKTQNLSALDADAAEGIELLDTLIDNIATDGNYSAEATLTFLSQIRQCFAAPSAPGTPEAPQTAAARDVLAERQRQVEVEGWHPDQDDDYEDGQLAGAAASYAIAKITNWERDSIIQRLWPWDRDGWKPADHRRNLVKSGALILAELERLDRAAAPKGGA